MVGRGAEDVSDLEDARVWGYPYELVGVDRLVWTERGELTHSEWRDERVSDDDPSGVGGRPGPAERGPRP